MRPGCPTEGLIYHRCTGELLETKTLILKGFSQPGMVPACPHGQAASWNLHAIQVTLTNGEHEGRNIINQSIAQAWLTA